MSSTEQYKQKVTGIGSEMLTSYLESLINRGIHIDSVVNHGQGYLVIYTERVYPTVDESEQED